MKICFFSHHSIANQDGASKSLTNIVNELSKSTDYEIIVVYPKKIANIKFESERIKILYFRHFSQRFPINSNSIFKKLSFRIKIMYNAISSVVLSKKLKREQIDIIHINGIDDIVPATVAKHLNIPYVWHIRQFMEEDLSQTIIGKQKMYKLMRRSACLIGISHKVCEKYSNILGCEVKCIYNGVPIENYEISNNHAFLQSRIQILLAGRIVEKKGQLDAVKAIHELVNQGIKNLKLIIIGTGDVAYINKIKNYIVNSNLDEYIDVKEYVDDLKSLRAQCDIGLVTSLNEAFGRVTIETFLSKMICIGADSGGTSELLLENVSGYKYAPGNYKELSEKIKYVISNADKQQPIISYSFDWAKSHFLISRVIDDITNIYNQIINQKLSEEIK